MNKKLKILISIILVVVLIAGGYVGNMFGVFNRGNYGEYSLKNTDAVENSPIKDKTVIFLGSSVTYGYGSTTVWYRVSASSRRPSFFALSASLSTEVKLLL